MPPKFKSSSPDETFVLQAVVLADSPEPRFRPMTLEKPRCLLPLVNVPLIEYTLEFLAIAGVEEIFVFCNSHADQVRKYLAGSKWSNKRKSSLKIHTILAPNAYSVGDVLRELDGKGLIRHDFILISGNIISNMKFDAVLEEHRARRGANKEVIMTMVMKKASPSHRSRAKGEGAVIAIDPMNCECLSYDVLPSIPAKRKITLETNMFKKHQIIQVHNDLLDCQIDICSPEVLALFTENFDYQDLRRDFVKGILTSDLYVKSIHVHVIGPEYAVRVKSTQLYDSVSKDIIERWAFPMAPDSNIHVGDMYRYYSGHVYKESDVTLARSSIVECKVVIGRGSEVGDSTRITRSTIGTNCKIGPNVIIEDAYIWDDVTIEANCTIKKCIIANNAFIKENTHVERGCLISFNVEIGPNITIPAFTRLTTMPPEEEDLVEPSKCLKEFIGHDKVVIYKWSPDWEEDVEEYEDEDPSNIKTRQIGFLPSDIEIGSNEEFIYSESDSDDSEEDYEDLMSRHLAEVKETVSRAINEGHTVENAVLELNALKMACNIQLRDIPPVIIPELLSRIESNNFMPSAKKVLEKWTPMISKFALSESDKMECLSITLQYCQTFSEDKTYGVKLFNCALRAYYFYDFIEDAEIVKQWMKTTKWSPDMQEYKKMTMKFIEDAVESSDEESTEEETSDEDD